MYPTQIKQSEGTAARRRIPIWLVDATDGIAAETGVTGTPRISKNGGASTAATNTITEVDSTNMPGLYYLELTAAEANTLGQVFASFKTAATAQWHGSAQIVDYDPFDAVALGLSRLDAAVTSRATPAQVNAQMVDVLTVDTIAELTQGIPAATPTLVAAIMLGYMALRNKLDVDSNFKEVHDDAGTLIFKKALTDAGSVYSEAKAESG